MTAVMNGSMKANRSNWNVKLRLRGFPPSVVFERSPVLGSNNVRVRPVSTKAWLIATLAARPELVTKFCEEYGIELAEGETLEALGLLPDIFPATIADLDGVMGYRSGDPLASYEGGFSYRIPVEDQILGVTSSVTTAPTVSTESVKQKIEQQRARIKAAFEDAAKKVIEETKSVDPTRPASEPNKVVDEVVATMKVGKKKV
jgi:hypothetical protein